MGWLMVACFHLYCMCLYWPSFKEPLCVWLHNCLVAMVRLEEASRLVGIFRIQFDSCPHWTRICLLPSLQKSWHKSHWSEYSWLWISIANGSSVDAFFHWTSIFALEQNGQFERLGRSSAFSLDAFRCIFAKEYFEKVKNIFYLYIKTSFFQLGWLGHEGSFASFLWQCSTVVSQSNKSIQSPSIEAMGSFLWKVIILLSN